MVDSRICVRYSVGVVEMEDRMGTRIDLLEIETMLRGVADLLRSDERYAFTEHLSLWHAVERIEDAIWEIRSSIEPGN